MPYVDMFDLKPIGIFILHAISLKLADSLIISYIFSLLCYIIISLLPLIFISLIIKIHEHKFFYYTLAFCLGVLFATYMDIFGGKLMPEIYGAFFSCIYIFLINTTFYVKHKKISRFILGLLMCIACNFKEPFLLMILSSCLIFIRNLKDFFQKFLIPFLIACVMGGAFLISLNLLVPYFEYLNYVIFVHSIVDKQTIFQRALCNISNIFFKLNECFKFSGYLFLLILAFPALNALAKNYPIKNKIKKAVFNGLKLLLALYIATMGIRSSGIYLPQHNGFFAPFIFALIIYFFKNKNYKSIFKNYYALVIYCNLLLIIFYYPTNLTVLYKKYEFFYNDKPQEEADYIDAILDRINEKTYLYIGNFGFSFYGFTKHSPKGKYVVQYDNWSGEKLPNFYDSMENNVKLAKLIVFEGFYDKKLRNKIKPLISKNFTKKIPPSLKDIKRPRMDYIILYNKSIR